MAAPPAGSEGESLLPEAAKEGDATEATLEQSPEAPCRQYIVDRCDGVSKAGEGEGRPPLRPCFPPPCVKWCPAILEQNAVCKLAGSCGLIKPDDDRWRARIFKVALASNIIGLVLTVVSCLSISLRYDLLMALGFSSGSLVSDNPRVPGAEIGIGLRGVAADLPSRGHTVWTFDEFCQEGFSTGVIQYFGDGVCHGCADVSAGLVSTLIMSIFTYLPNIFTDFNRMHSNYDVNCQKMFGSLVSLLSLAMTLYTWRAYTKSCFSVFYEGIVPYDRRGFAMSPDEVDTPEKRLRIFVNMDFDWRAGNGLICVVAATMLKFVDIFCNWLVPTPTITRNKDEQIEYEAFSLEAPLI